MSRRRARSRRSSRGETSAYDARREQHSPESDSGTKLNDSPFIWKGVEPEHRAVKFALPRRASEWAAIVWRTIQVPRLEFVGMLWWWQESKSCWHTTLANFGCTSSYGCCRRWRKRNPNRWLPTFGASTQPLL